MLKAIYHTIRDAVSHIPGGNWLLGWTDPLHIARRLLAKTMADRAHYVQGWVLDVGCGLQPYRAIFGHVQQYIGIDLPGTGVMDACASGMALPFRNASFDSIICNEVLEHVPEPSLLISEAARVLKPGGILLLTTPQTWGLHHEPYDFFRYTPYGLRYLAEKNTLTVIEVLPTCGLWATLTQRFTDTVAHKYLARSPRVLVVVVCIVMAPLQLIGYGLDKLFGKRGDTLDNVLLARKPIS